MDTKENQLVSIGSLNGFQTVGGFGLNSYSFTEPVWVGVEPNGISVLDRLENKIILLDYRLNYMTAISLEPRIFPELAVIDKYGLIYIYSSQYHSISVPQILYPLITLFPCLRHILFSLG